MIEQARGSGGAARIGRRGVPAALALLLGAGPVTAAEVHQVDVVDIIHAVSAARVLETIGAAEEAEADLVLVRLDTPGGLDTSMREIIEAILNSEVPVAVYVGPSGSRAASAGYLITLAADVSGMAPGTNMGAATPVSTGGEMPETLSRKVESDAAAYLRSIAERRGRDVELAEQGVTEARSWTASEALEAGLIDLVADDAAAFVEALHGRTVRRIDGEEVVLDTEGATIVQTEMSIRDRALSVIANPSLAVLLGMVGLLGLYLEFSNPGLLIPGVLGVIALLLAGFGLNLLPVSALGIALLLVGIGLLTAEALTPSFGLMGLSGAVALVLGLLFFYEEQSLPTPALDLSVGLVIPTVIVFAVIVFFLGQMVVRSQRNPPVSGVEGMVGDLATASTDIAAGGTGKVFIQGEYWDAEATAAISSGERAPVLAVEGLLLRVGPAVRRGLAQPASDQDE